MYLFSPTPPFSRRVATSFEGKYGRIRYWLKAEIDKPWGFNSKTKRAFTVIDHIDINTQSLLVSTVGKRSKCLVGSYLLGFLAYLSPHDIRTTRLDTLSGRIRKGQWSVLTGH